MPGVDRGLAAAAVGQDHGHRADRVGPLLEPAFGIGDELLERQRRGELARLARLAAHEGGVVADVEQAREHEAVGRHDKPREQPRRTAQELIHFEGPRLVGECREPLPPLFIRQLVPAGDRRLVLAPGDERQPFRGLLAFHLDAHHIWSKRRSRGPQPGQPDVGRGRAVGIRKRRQGRVVDAQVARSQGREPLAQHRDRHGHALPAQRRHAHAEHAAHPPLLVHEWPAVGARVDRGGGLQDRARVAVFPLPLHLVDAAHHAAAERGPAVAQQHLIDVAAGVGGRAQGRQVPCQRQAGKSLGVHLDEGRGQRFVNRHDGGIAAHEAGKQHAHVPGSHRHHARRREHVTLWCDHHTGAREGTAVSRRAGDAHGAAQHALGDEGRDGGRLGRRRRRGQRGDQTQGTTKVAVECGHRLACSWPDLRPHGSTSLRQPSAPVHPDFR